MSNMDKSLSSYEKQMAASHTAMTERRYQDVTQLSTEALEEVLENHVLRLFDLRSTANENQGFLSKALEDATSMVQYRPTSALGYLKSSSIHLTSGKPDLAVNSYKRGLEIVPKSHPQYRQMQEEHEMAILRARSRFDIIGKLPLELLRVVLDNVEDEARWVCLTVSRKWCDQVTRCGSWWDTVFINQTDTRFDEIVCKTIPFVQDHIQHLTISNIQSNDLKDRYLVRLKHGVFKNIKTLSLKEGLYDNMEPEEFAIALWQMRDTLRELKLEFGAAKSYRLLSVLATCPNLESLSYITAGDIAFRVQDQKYASRITCKKLLKLELQYRLAPFSYGDAIWPHIAVCSNLHRLVLRASPTQRLCDTYGTTFSDYCPNLKVLHINCVNRMTDRMVEGITDDFQCSNDWQGVACISIEIDDDLACSYAFALIELQSHSLVRLSITDTQDDILSDDDDDDDDEPYTGSTYTKLSALQYMGYGSYINPNGYSITEDFVLQIIRNSPSLVDLSLLYLSAHMGFRSIVEQAVKTKIQTLMLKKVSFIKTDTDWYKSFLSSLDRVQTLEIQSCGFLNDNVIVYLAASESIRQLTLTECTNITDNELIEFFKHVALRPSHHLEVLSLSSISASLTKRAIQYMVKTKNLDRLIITGDKSMDIEIMYYLASQAPYSSLKKIEILNCFLLADDTSKSRCVANLQEKGITLVIN